jgi:hypothetical protein
MIKTPIEMENGKWKMENGKWKMENGKWKMENGKWKMENRKWKMVNGKWNVECGMEREWGMENGLQVKGKQRGKGKILGLTDEPPNFFSPVGHGQTTVFYVPPTKKI